MKLLIEIEKAWGIAIRIIDVVIYFRLHRVLVNGLLSNYIGYSAFHSGDKIKQILSSGR